MLPNNFHSSQANALPLTASIRPLSTVAEELPLDLSMVAQDLRTVSQIARSSGMDLRPEPRRSAPPIQRLDAVVNYPYQEDEIPDASDHCRVDFGPPRDLGPAPAIRPPRTFCLGYRHVAPIPKIINRIWIGGHPISNTNYNNFLNTARLNPGADIRIYIDSKDRGIDFESLANYSGFDAACELRKLPNVCLIRAREGEFGNFFASMNRDAQAFYERCLESGQYAMASDVLRYAAVLREGGAYIDADDELLTQLDFNRLNAAPDEILHANPCTFPSQLDETYVFLNNSMFAARAGCSMLSEIIDRIGANFREHVRMESAGYKGFDFDNPLPYVFIHSMCGPGVFTNVLQEYDNRSSALLKGVSGRAIHGKIASQLSRHVPFSSANRQLGRFIRGEDHSWKNDAIPTALKGLSIEEPRGLSLPDADGLRRDGDGNLFIRAEGLVHRVSRTESPERTRILTPEGGSTEVFAIRTEDNIWEVPVETTSR